VRREREGEEVATNEGASPLYPLLTRDPASGGELIVTRLECPASGVVIEGRFSLGWMARLTPEQLEFVRLLLRNRANVQKLAAELNMAYNTARSRLDEIVAVLGADDVAEATRSRVLERLAAGEIAFDEAVRLLQMNPLEE
jgi:hypothetical protein